MVDDFRHNAQRDADHSKIADTTDNQQDDLFSVLRDADGITHESDDNDQALTTAEEFERYCAENPVVYTVMVRLSRSWINKFGDAKLGVRALLEKSRWEVRFATNDPNYKVNNNWAPWFGRLIMYREPGMAGRFELRRAPEADAWITELAAREGRLDELPRLMGWATDDTMGRAA